MIRQNTVNTFTGGLVSDLEPLSTPNNVLTDCLNGTISTFNGNADTLQTDMGNAKIGAYLPEGYIPLGSASLDGIIYIVSYNPLTKECQIGSYPSPQRDFTTDDTGEGKITLNNDTFEDTQGIKTYLYIGDLGQEVNPGDLFYTYFNSINKDDFLHLYDKNNESQQIGYIKLSIGYLDNNNQIHKLKDITYDTKHKEIEHTRKLSVDYNTSNPFKVGKYKVYNTKVAGNLILIAELVKPNTFNITVKHKIEKETETEKENICYAPEFSWTLSNYEKDYFKTINIHYIFEIKDDKKYDVIQNISEPKYENILKDKKFQITKKSVTYIENGVTKYHLKKYNGTNYVDCTTSAEVKDFFNSLLIQENSNTNIKITVIPELEYGKIDLLKQEFNINLKDVNTGKVSVRKYQYLNEYEIVDNVQQNTYQFYLQLDSYPEEDKPITEMRIDLYPKTDVSPQEDTGKLIFKPKPENKLDSIPIISNNGSFHGTFTTEPKSYDEKVKPNDVYIASIVYTIGESEETLVSYLFFTDNYWNELYKAENINNFGTLKYDRKPNVIFNNNDDPKSFVKNSKKFGRLQTNVEDKSYSTNSYNCYKTHRIITSTVNLSYPESRNWAFNIQLKSINVDKDKIASIYTSEQQFDGASLLVDESIFNKNVGILDEDQTTIDGSDCHNQELNIEHSYYVKVNAEVVNNSELKITYDDNRFEKIYTKKGLKDCQYLGSLKPLAYNDATYNKYNLGMYSYNTYVNNTIESIKDGSQINKYVSYTNFLITVIGDKYYISCTDPDHPNSTYRKDYYNNFQLEVTNIDGTSDEDIKPVVGKQPISEYDFSKNLGRVYLRLMSKDNSDIYVEYYFIGQIIKLDDKYYFNVLNPQSLTLQNGKFDISLYGKIVNPSYSIETTDTVVQNQQFFPKFLGVYNMGNSDQISIGSIDSNRYTTTDAGIDQTKMPRSKFFFANDNIVDNLHIAGWNNNLLFAIYDCDDTGRNLDSDINGKIVSNPVRRKKSNDKSTIAVIVFIKFNNVFIPIKTVDHALDISNLEQGTWKGVYDSIVQKLKNYFQDIASILNAIYQYNNDIINIQKYLPQENIWTYNAEYKTVVPTILTYTITPKIIENITTNTDSINGTTSRDYEIKYKQDNVIMQTMLDHIVSCSDTNLRTALYDINGISIISGIPDNNLNSNSLYLIQDGSINRSATKVNKRIFTLNDSGELNIQETNEIIDNLDSEINSNFKIENGILTLRNPSYIGRKFKSHVDIGSFQNFGLLVNKYAKYEYPH